MNVENKFEAIFNCEEIRRMPPTTKNLYGDEGGIRTHGAVTPSGFRDQRIQPTLPPRLIYGYIRSEGLCVIPTSSFILVIVPCPEIRVII